MTLRTDGPISNRAGGPANLTMQWAAKAWASLNGAGTISLRGSKGISSVIDIGTGQYQFNFAAVLQGGLGNSTVATSNYHHVVLVTGDATQITFQNSNSSNSNVDSEAMSISVNGDLA